MRRRLRSSPARHTSRLPSPWLYSTGRSRREIATWRRMEQPLSTLQYCRACSAVCWRSFISRRVALRISSGSRSSTSGEDEAWRLADRAAAWASCWRPKAARAFRAAPLRATLTSAPVAVTWSTSLSRKPCCQKCWRTFVHSSPFRDRLASALMSLLIAPRLSLLGAASPLWRPLLLEPGDSSAPSGFGGSRVCLLRNSRTLSPSVCCLAASDCRLAPEEPRLRPSELPRRRSPLRNWRTISPSDMRWPPDRRAPRPRAD
mmetsp:Transcript_64190/g.182088  ORF Transcript_64190/g.182088 Transcript_64190/m.182088 type:complete len:260 (-) Transcript_64190:170-949(-)